MSAVLPAFQRFLDDHREEVWRLLVATVGREQAEDCFQETFMAALRAYPRLRPGSDARAWVLTIAHRKALDAHRSRARATNAVAAASAAGASSARAGAANGRQAATQPEYDERLWSAVRELPERQRSAVVLRCLADLPHRQVASAIGCSEDAARRSWHDGLRKLREAMADG